LAAKGEVALVQDADLEYDPAEFPLLLAPIERGRAEVVYGSRSFAAHSAYSFWFVIGNKLVTLWTNVLFNSYLSDMETCYKLMPLSVWRSLDLRSDGFDIEPEITAKLLKNGHRIYEVPISYAARGRVEGKKLTWRDGVTALWTLSRIRIAPRKG
jgi:glycosyl transferase family 2